MIQNRITTVTCSQPSISKWWCSGAIRKTRWPGWTRKTVRNSPLARLTLKTETWIITDSVIDHEQPADDQQQQLGAGQDRQPGQRAAQGQRAGVAHEDGRRRGVPPQEAEAGAGDRRRDDGEVERVAHLVAGGPAGGRAALVVLPDVDQRVGARRPGSTRRWRGRRGRRRGSRALLVPVMITQISTSATTVGRASHWMSRRKEMWCDAGVLPRSSSSSGHSASDAEDQRDHGLADHLGPAAQAEAALPADLDEVVEEPDGAEADEEEEEQQRRGRRLALGDDLGREVADHRPRR